MKVETKRPQLYNYFQENEQLVYIMYILLSRKLRLKTLYLQTVDRVRII